MRTLRSESKHDKRGSYLYIDNFEVQISSKEKEILRHLKPSELMIRMLTGQLDVWLRKVLKPSSTKS